MNENPGSFRDPSGRVYETGDGVFRSINAVYKPHFEKLLASGLYKSLVDKGLLLPFTETPQRIEGAWKTIEVERIPFIGYPYEWGFHQLKDASLLTLKIQQEALRHEMILKDASAYNVQFFKGKPIFIDLASFETYVEGMPWNAYRQYISHFMGPLLLMASKDIRHGLQYRNFLDGIPVDYVSRNLPRRTWLSPSTLINVHLHAGMLKKHESTEHETKVTIRPIPLKSQFNMVDGLLAATEGIKNPSLSTEWGNYYEHTNYDSESFRRKGEILEKICASLKPKKACDLGANLGEFSRIFAKHAGIVISPDIDPVAVDKNYVLTRKNKEANIYPLIQDLCNPSPAIGWMNRERPSFLERARCDLAAGLAIIHHLCIGNNLPLEFVAEMFWSIAPNAILEFVPKEDGQVKRLLSVREDIFPQYDLDHCRTAFEKYYSRCESYPIEGTCRTILYFTERR